MNSPLDDLSTRPTADKGPMTAPDTDPHSRATSTERRSDGILRGLTDISIPELTDGGRELATSLVPGDEVDFVYAQYRAALSDVVRKSSVQFLPDHVDNPPEPKMLDQAIRKQLIAIAKRGIMGGLAKMAWVSYVVIADEYLLSESRVEMLPAAVLHRRLHQSDFYLSEFRRLQENESSKAWTVTLQSPDGKSVVQKMREFPMWGIEHENKLDNYKKAKAWYKAQLMERSLAK